MKRKLNENDVPEVVEEENEEATAPTKSNFSSLGLDARLLQSVHRAKFSTPTPVQAKAIPLALSGKHILARSKTGSGKTLAYILPIIHSLLQYRTKDTSALILVPTKELAAQVSAVLISFIPKTSGIRVENLTKKEDALVTRARLTPSSPEIVVTTPSRAIEWASNQDLLQLNKLEWLVLDEADLVLSFGYEDDLRQLSELVPKSGMQTVMMSATLRTETEALTKLFCSTEPTVLDFSAEEAKEKQTLEQYVIRTAEEDKFLLIYAIFKLKLIQGKVIVFVADTDRAYRVKLFLEQFAIRSCVLNSELPVNSRAHVVEEFNRGVYEIIITSGEGEDEVAGEPSKKKRRKVDKHQTSEATHNDENGDETAADQDRDPFTLSRGIDFTHIACVLNFDLPTSAESYTHRIGRTARAGKTGMALSFYIPRELYRKHKPTSIEQCKHDETTLASIRATQEAQGKKISEWQFDMTKLEAFRYRFTDALRNVTRLAVREARTAELKRELINSTRLQRHWEENPALLGKVKHGEVFEQKGVVRRMGHLRHVPDYLLPNGGVGGKKDVGFVSFRSDREKKRAGKSGRVGRKKAGEKRGRDGGARKRGSKDPLKSLRVSSK